jgi:hypothetical protein
MIISCAVFFFQNELDDKSTRSIFSLEQICHTNQQNIRQIYYKIFTIPFTILSLLKLCCLNVIDVVRLPVVVDLYIFLIKQNIHVWSVIFSPLLSVFPHSLFYTNYPYFFLFFPFLRESVGEAPTSIVFDI